MNDMAAPVELLRLVQFCYKKRSFSRLFLILAFGIMSLNIPSSPVYKTSAVQKRHAKEVAKKLRHGSTNIRDVLREKCRIRINAARSSCLDAKRTGLADIDEILRLELAELEHDITLQEEIYNELLEEFKEWYDMMAEQELEVSYQIAMSEETKDLLCPVCMQKPLSHEPSKKIYKCECSIVFHYSKDIMELREALNTKIEEHSAQCTQALNFFVEPQGSADGSELMRLSGICYTCDHMLNL